VVPQLGSEGADSNSESDDRELSSDLGDSQSQGSEKSNGSVPLSSPAYQVLTSPPPSFAGKLRAEKEKASSEVHSHDNDVKNGASASVDGSNVEVEGESTSPNGIRRRNMHGSGHA
jgi:hypothetical protein